MRIFGIFRKNKEQKNDLPKECPSVIERGGRIARVGDQTAEMRHDQPIDTIKKEKKNNFPENMQIETVQLRSADYKEERPMRKKKSAHTIDSGSRTPFPIATVLIFLFCTALVMTTIVNMVQIDGYSKEVKQLEKQVNALEATKTELTAELAEKNSTEELKKFIEDAGMVSEENTKGQITITPDTDESITDFEVEEKKSPVVSVVLSAVMGNFLDAVSFFLE